MDNKKETSKQSANYITDHSRQWRKLTCVYPVISRRSKGLSVGINLNLNQLCNFDCIYCQVDRTAPPAQTELDLTVLHAELEWLLGYAASGAIWQEDQFRDVPKDWQRINDIAFSGDGEPTLEPLFEQACQLVGELKKAHGLTETKITLLTNATLLDRPNVQRGLEILDQNNGEIWAKLDAGTESYYKLIDRSGVSLERVLKNITEAGQSRSIVIQSLLMNVHGQMISEEEFDAYLDRLADLLEAQCQIKLVQLYTIARQTAEPFVTPLTGDQLEQLARRFEQRLPQLLCEVYG